MVMLYRAMTLQEIEDLQRAALAVLKSYDVAQLDAQVKLPSHMHAAILLLRRSLEQQ